MAQAGLSRTKKALLGIGVLALAGAGVFWGVLPWVVDGRKNAEIPHSPYPVSDEAMALHKTLTIADLHADSMLWSRDCLDRHDYGLVDLPRLNDGNVAIQVFGLVTQVPPYRPGIGGDPNDDQVTPLVIGNRWPIGAWTSLLQRATHQSWRLHDAAARSKGGLTVVRTSGELKQVLQRRAQGEPVVAGLLGLEGVHALEGDVANIQVLDEAGVRLIGLAHFADNFAAGSAHGMQKHGLTDDGKALLQEIERRQLIVDVAHSSPKTIEEVLALGTRPVVVSHGGVQGTCPGERNLSDAQVRAIAAGGGIIGIGLWEIATCGTDLHATVRAIRHVADLVGVAHVALGMDMDGSIHAFIDVSEMAAITQLLLDDGFSHEEVAQIMGGNTRDFLLKWLPQ